MDILVAALEDHLTMRVEWEGLTLDESLQVEDILRNMAHWSSDTKGLCE